MKVCVFHERIAGEIASAIAADLPHVEVIPVADTARDPADPGGIDVLVANTFPAGMLGRMPHLRWLQLTGAGTDHVASGDPPPHLLVTHAGSIPARAVAEFVLMGALAFAKDALTLVEQQRRRAWHLPGARLLAGSTMVLLGLGNIGREVARRASAFDVRVIGITRTGAPVPGIDEVRPVTELLEAARGAEYLVVAVPATSSTRGLVDEKVVRALSPDGVLINVARACVVDIQAVVHALRDGHLRGALLDVHDTEPLPADSPLWTVERLWITPHCAFRYPEETRDLSRLIIDNLIRFESGRELRNLVSRDPLLTRR